LQLEIPAFREPTPWFIRDGIPEDAPMVEATIQGELPPGARKLDATWKEPYDVVLIVTIRQGSKADMKPIVSGERMTLAEREPQAETLQPTERHLGSWIKLGFIHILPEGMDHILFVLGLFLLAPKWKPLLQQTITFTIAHSISLALAFLGWVNVSSDEARHVVDFLIFASIAWVGVENLLVKELGKGRLALVGIFGLIHGLGFASQLVGLSKDQPDKLPSALLGFNLGVEFAQVVVILIAFALVGWWKGEFKWIRRIGSILVAMAGLGLVVGKIIVICR
jgi:hydrogenase/urease accessory protein HupE